MQATNTAGSSRRKEALTKYELIRASLPRLLHILGVEVPNRAVATFLESIEAMNNLKIDFIAWLRRIYPIPWLGKRNWFTQARAPAVFRASLSSASTEGI